MMDIGKNSSLKSLNTFGIEASAKLLAKIYSEDDLLELIGDKKYEKERKLILGGGSNILVTGDVDGLVVLNRIEGVSNIKEDMNDVYVQVKAGMLWHKLVLYALQNNLGGIENLSLIPGCVGAAPMQNIGAYGVELKEVFVELEAWDLLSGERRIFSLNDCEFGYRMSVFKTRYKNRFVITSVTLRLTKQNHKLNTTYGAIEQELKNMGVMTSDIHSISRAVIHIRSSKLPDPAKIGNAGSFFKNPEVPKDVYDSLKEKYPELVGYPVPFPLGSLPAGRHGGRDGSMKLAAGWLIEQCGWKGKVSGQVGMHKQQALVLVNYGGATGAELYDHALKVQHSVKEKFGVELEMEVNVV